MQNYGVFDDSNLAPLQGSCRQRRLRGAVLPPAPVLRSCHPERSDEGAESKDPFPTPHVGAGAHTGPLPPAPHPNAFPSGEGGAQRRKRCLPLWGRCPEGAEEVPSPLGKVARSAGRGAAIGRPPPAATNTGFPGGQWPPLRSNRKPRSIMLCRGGHRPPARFLPWWEQKGKLCVFSPSALRAPPSSEGGKLRPAPL